MTEPTYMPTITAYYHTFGCKLNFAETATVRQMLVERGIIDVEGDNSPDLIIVNTCSVTELADKKCRQTIRSYAKRWPNASIVVTGCYAQLKPEEAFSLPGVVLVAGNDRKLLLAKYIDNWLAEHTPLVEVTPGKDIKEFNPSCSRGGRTRFFLKVQDGCDYYCSYCTIPYARGRSRSGSVAEMVASAQRAAAEGGKEIVLTGVNIGDFGKGTAESFLDLITQLDKVDGIERYRISSIEPNLLTDDIIDWVAQSQKFMPHFHIPLQSGDDEILRLMKRHYDTELFAERVSHIRKVMPDAFIGVDLIAGARGETDLNFENSKKFVESLDISRLHVFPYSERPGTLALRIPHVVSQEEKHRRVKIMLDISDRKLETFARRFVGHNCSVLLEHSDGNGLMSGYTENYLRVLVKALPSQSNTIVPVCLSDNIILDNNDVTILAEQS